MSMSKYADTALDADVSFGVGVSCEDGDMVTSDVMWGDLWQSRPRLGIVASLGLRLK